MYDVCPGCGKNKDADNLKCWLCQFEDIMCSGISVYHIKHRELNSPTLHDFITIPPCIKRAFYSFYEKIDEVPVGASYPWFIELQTIDGLSKFDDYLSAKKYHTIPSVINFFNRKVLEDINSDITKIKLCFFEREPIVYNKNEIVVMRNGKSYKAHELIVGDIISNKDTNGLKICKIEKQK